MDRQQRLVVAALTALLLAVVLPPLFILGIDAARAHGGVVDVLTSPRLRTLWFRSFALSSSVAAGSLMVGVPLGVLFGRCDVAGRRAAWALHALPLFLPPFLLALGWFEGLRATFGSASALFSSPSAAAILVLALSPIVTSLTAFAAARIDPALIEAALVVARPRVVLSRVVWPACRGPAALGAVIVFAMTFAELGVPLFLRVDVYPAAVFLRLGGVRFDPGEAAALAMPMVLVAAATFAAERRLASPSFAALAKDARSGGAVVSLREARWPLSISLWAIAILGIMPLLALSWKASAATGAGFASWLNETPQNTLAQAGVAAMSITLVGVVLGHARARNVSVARMVDAALVFAFVVPPTVLGIGMVAVWNRSSTQFIYGSIAIVVFALTARYAVLAVRMFAAAFARSPPALEDAARVCGAGYFRRMVRVVLPMERRSLVGTFVLVMVFCMRDFETPVLLYPAGAAPLIVQIFTLEANGPPAIVAALAMTDVAMTAVLLAIAAWTMRAGARRPA